MKITFANWEKGVGKTTMAIVTAETLIANSHAIDLFDFDPQHKMTQRLKLNENCISRLRQMLHNQSYCTKEGFTVVNTALGNEKIVHKAITSSDIIVVPIIADPAAVAGIGHIVKMHPKGKILVVFNKYNVNLANERTVLRRLTKIVAQCATKTEIECAIITLPYSEQLAANIAHDRYWAYGMPDSEAKEFMDFVSRITGKDFGI